jgi:hypothetical protein
MPDTSNWGKNKPSTSSFGASPPRPPHPATVVQRRPAHSIHQPQRPPHPATVLQQRQAHPIHQPQRPSHPAIVLQQRPVHPVLTWSEPVPATRRSMKGVLQAEHASRAVIQTRWEQGCPHEPPNPRCNHGDGTAGPPQRVQINVYPYKCPSCPTFVSGSQWSSAGVCSACGQQAAPLGTRVVVDTSGGSMEFVDTFPGPGYTFPIYQCAICGCRYSNAPGFGAQEDSPFCGTAGNMWK